MGLVIDPIGSPFTCFVKYLFELTFTIYTVKKYNSVLSTLIVLPNLSWTVKIYLLRGGFLADLCERPDSLVSDCPKSLLLSSRARIGVES